MYVPLLFIFRQQEEKKVGKLTRLVKRRESKRERSSSTAVQVGERSSSTAVQVGERSSSTAVQVEERSSSTADQVGEGRPLQLSR